VFGRSQKAQPRTEPKSEVTDGLGRRGPGAEGEGRLLGAKQSAFALCIEATA